MFKMFLEAMASGLAALAYFYGALGLFLLGLWAFGAI
jgi:hypothetical protein